MPDYQDYYYIKNSSSEMLTVNFQLNHRETITTELTPFPNNNSIMENTHFDNLEKVNITYKDGKVKKFKKGFS